MFFSKLGLVLSPNEVASYDIQATSDESSSLKQVIVILRPSLLSGFTRQFIGRFRESAVVIDYGELLHDIVVVACRVES